MKSHLVAGFALTLLVSGHGEVDSFSSENSGFEKGYTLAGHGFERKVCFGEGGTSRGIDAAISGFEKGLALSSGGFVRGVCFSEGGISRGIYAAIGGFEKGLALSGGGFVRKSAKNGGTSSGGRSYNA